MASSQYASVTDLIEAYDQRLVADLVSDAGSPGDVDDDNPIITTALQRASEEVQMAVTQGGRYTTTQLDTLNTDDRWALQGLVCDLAIGRLFARRGGQLPEAISEVVDAARETLSALKNGDAVFPLAAARTSGKATISIISRTSRANLDLVSDEPFFPKRHDTRVS